MKKRLLLLLLVLPMCRLAHGQYVAVSGNCQLPGQVAVVSGLPQSGTQPLSGSPFTVGSGVMASYPQCLVTVYPPNSSTPVSTGNVFSNSTGTVLGNPFTANTDGSWVFFVAVGCYDVTLSSGTTPASQMPSTKTLSGQCGGSGGGGGGSVTGATPNGGLLLTGTTLGLTTAGCFFGYVEAFTGTLWQCQALGATYGVDATIYPGANPGLQTQAAIYAQPVGACAIINATKFTTFTSSVNFYATPGQTNPNVYTGMPVCGLVLLPGIPIVVDVPHYVPNKWMEQGVPGYGAAPGKTTIQPSTTFVANRPALSAVGTGSTGLSATGGFTVTITGTTLPSAANLEGMFLLAASNASATAIPDSTNAMIGGCITNVSGNVLTLGGVGASGTVTNTGWTILPVIAGWACGGQGYAVMGAKVDWLTSSCQTPSATYVNPGCIAWLNTTGQEFSELTNFSGLYFDYMCIGIFTNGAQDGGPFGPITCNSKGKGTNSTIGIQAFGTGFNAAGGGATGLCSLSNPCSGTSIRRIHDVTMLLDGTGGGTGGIGVDIAAINFRLEGPASHCEGCSIFARVGYSGTANGVVLDSLSGSSASSSALVSVVAVSSNYANVGVPGPTQNITLTNIARGFASTLPFQDYINLTTDISDAVVGKYSIGSAGTLNTQVWTDTQNLTCVTTGGVVSTDGSTCAAASQIGVSVMNNEYYAYGFGPAPATKDVCQQISNAFKLANANGLTEGVIVHAGGFVNKFGNPCGISPWASGPGTYPYSGRLELPASTLFLSLPWTIPANWMVTGSGGNGIGVGGGTGTNLSPNLGNTVNANYGNLTTSGTISCTVGAYTCTLSTSSYSSTYVNSYLMACATLPCTTQSTMVRGLVTSGSGTSITLAEPAQATLSAAAYTITSPMVTNNGVMRDMGVDSNGYATGCFVAALETGTSGSYIENFSGGHINCVGIGAVGLNSGAMLRGPIQINGSGIASSVFTCIDAPQGISITEGLTCQSNMVTTPSLSYGVLTGGQGLNLNGLSFQNVNIGLELLVNSGFSTNGITVSGVAGGPGASAVNTLIDIAGISSGGANANALAVNILGINAGGATSTIVDHLQSYTLTDPELNYYLLGKQAGGCRTFQQDGHTTAIPQSITCGVAQYGSPVNVAGLPTCNSGSQFSLAAVLDSTSSPAWGATVTGGGSTPVTVQCNGTNWTIFAK